MKNLNVYVAAQQDTVAKSLAEFITEGAKQGWTLQKPKGAAGVVFQSKAGNPQILFTDKENNRIYVRISSNLDAALRGGEKINLAEAPVYHVALENLGGTPGTAGNMLVVGMKAEAQEFEAVDTKTAFSGAYVTPVA